MVSTETTTAARAPSTSHLESIGHHHVDNDNWPSRRTEEEEQQDGHFHAMAQRKWNDGAAAAAIATTSAVDCDASVTMRPTKKLKPCNDYTDPILDQQVQNISSNHVPQKQDDWCCYFGDYAEIWRSTSTNTTESDAVSRNVMDLENHDVAASAITAGVTTSEISHAQEEETHEADCSGTDHDPTLVISRPIARTSTRTQLRALSSPSMQQQRIGTTTATVTNGASRSPTPARVGSSVLSINTAATTSQNNSSLRGTIMTAVATTTVTTTVIPPRSKFREGKENVACNGQEAIGMLTASVEEVERWHTENSFLLMPPYTIVGNGTVRTTLI